MLFSHVFATDDQSMSVDGDVMIMFSAHLLSIENLVLFL